MNAVVVGDIEDHYIMNRILDDIVQDQSIGFGF
jgi:hypothetical protein